MGGLEGYEDHTWLHLIGSVVWWVGIMSELISYMHFYFYFTVDSIPLPLQPTPHFSSLSSTHVFIHPPP